MDVIRSNVVRRAALVLAVLMVALGNTSALVIVKTTTTDNSFGQCPTYPTVTPFNKVDYDGEWNVYQQTVNHIESGWSCKKLIYNELNTGFTYSFKSGNLPTSYVGTYTVPDQSRGAFSVALKYMLALGADSYGRVNQFVVAGDPSQYMIVRSCTFYPDITGKLGFNTQSVYILTRSASPNDATKLAIAAALGSANINTASLQTVGQTGC